jgi:hypothetical protein
MNYKATDKDMKCRDVQFALGEWSEPAVGELELCKNGYHFCTSMSGVWEYYPDTGSRIFECEVEDVVSSSDPGACAKSICRRVKLTKEVTPGSEVNIGYGNTGDSNAGDSNTGNKNTGNKNTGDSNAGDRNTGDRNTGDKNTGHWNTGYGNTGHWNTGNWNTGNSNTGYGNIGYGNTGNSNTGNSNTGGSNTGGSNTGDKNTGNSNTGDRNTGNRNTGHGNTGDKNTGCGNTGHGNTGNRNTGEYNVSSDETGFFCTEERTVFCFDKDSGLNREELLNMASVCVLISLLSKDKPFDYTTWSAVPNATEEKVRKLHEKVVLARNLGKSTHTNK